MPYSRNLATYTDVTRVLDLALRHHGISFTMPRKEKATSWRHRAYAYLNRVRRKMEEANANVPGYIATTPYDNLIIRIKDDTRICVEFRDDDFFENALDITDGDGNPIDPKREPRSGQGLDEYEKELEELIGGGDLDLELGGD